LGIFNGFLKQLGTGDKIKDFQHASKLFVGDNFRLAPKHGYLYHVFFDLDPSLTRVGREQQIESGMLVKSVDLPKFTIDVKTMNSYNKPNIVQNKIKYDQINISFHDDSADVVRNLWFDYYHYYYRDTDLGYSDKSGGVNPTYFASTKYGTREKNNYGYSPRNYSVGTALPQYIKSIRIYSLHQKRFSEYTLINPIITAFRHGQHQAGSADPMAHEMTIQYEHVLYAAGNVNNNTVKGFADIHYDNSPSPLTPAGGGTASLLGPGGLVDTTNSVIEDLSKDPPDYAAAAFKSFRGLQNLKSMDLKKAASAELGQIGMDMLRGNNPLNRIAIPNFGSLAGGAASTFGSTSNGGGNATNDAISNGAGIGSSKGLAAAGTVLAGLGASVLVNSKAGGGVNGLLAVGGIIAGTGALNKIININPTTGKADSVSTLPDKTAAEQKIANIPGSDVASKTFTGENSNTEAADAAAKQNIEGVDANRTAAVDANASETSTPPVRVFTTSEINTPVAVTEIPVGTAEEQLQAQLSAREAEASQNPDSNLNSDAAQNPPFTDQGDVLA
jgi:hypothetical protein